MPLLVQMPCGLVCAPRYSQPPYLQWVLLSLTKFHAISTPRPEFVSFSLAGADVRLFVLFLLLSDGNLFSPISMSTFSKTFATTLARPPNLTSLIHPLAQGCFTPFTLRGRSPAVGMRSLPDRFFPNATCLFKRHENCAFSHLSVLDSNPPIASSQPSIDLRPEERDY